MEARWMRDAVAFAVALVCVLALVPLIHRLCVRWRIFDQPGELKIHREPIPRLGAWRSCLRWRRAWCVRSMAREAVVYFLRRRLGWCGWIC
jgi:hypothetical protein